MFAGIAIWAFAIYNRLLRLRDRVREAWRHLESDQASESAKTVYNRRVKDYNDTLEGFPVNVVGMPPASSTPAIFNFHF